MEFLQGLNDVNLKSSSRDVPSGRFGGDADRCRVRLQDKACFIERSREIFPIYDADADLLVAVSSMAWALFLWAGLEILG
jgi:hypothetical protein